MSRPGSIVHGPSLFTELDVYLFREGNHFQLYDKLGPHVIEVDGVSGILFSVWAPDARSVSVIGDFNEWNRTSHPLAPRSDQSGIWEGFIPGLCEGTLYKYFVSSKFGGYEAEKGDPFARLWESPPRTASVVYESAYAWGDGDWMARRKSANSHESPFSIYEVHLGSWRRAWDENRSLGYLEMADQLVHYVRDSGFTHVQLMPVMEHPFYGSWGYQTTGYFAPTHRYGKPDDFKNLIDHLHRNGIGVILDWAPAHFPSDQHGLAFFDGTHLYEHADHRRGYHPDWNTYIFNYGRNEVRNFLGSSALFWLDHYHVDGLRVDAVASMLYLDYSRKDGEWIPNEHGGRENTEAVSFLKRMNEVAYGRFPDIMTIAEESTAWPMVSRPVHSGGLGFGMKMNLGWMNDSLEFFSRDPIHRRYHQNQFTFSIWYAFTENFLLPLSHDEVVYGKGSLIEKMPGDDWQKFANLRLLYGCMYTHPGKKMIFMGGEFAQRSEWDHETALDWPLLDHESHRGVHQWVRDLNRVMKNEPALYQLDFDPGGFQWIDCQDHANSIVSFLRRGRAPEDTMIIVANLTPVLRTDYRVGAPWGGWWRELLNSDAREYWGSGQGNKGGVTADDIPFHGFSHSISLTLPPLSILFLRRDAR